MKPPPARHQHTGGSFFNPEPLIDDAVARLKHAPTNIPMRRKLRDPKPETTTFWNPTPSVPGEITQAGMHSAQQPNEAGVTQAGLHSAQQPQEAAVTQAGLHSVLSPLKLSVTQIGLHIIYVPGPGIPPPPVPPAEGCPADDFPISASSDRACSE